MMFHCPKCGYTTALIRSRWILPVDVECMNCHEVLIEDNSNFPNGEWVSDVIAAPEVADDRALLMDIEF